MAVIALASAKGSPGVTTTALAMALSWPRPVLLVEADPAGGDVLAGFVRAELPADRGIAYAAVAARYDRIAEDFNAQLIDIAPDAGGTGRVLLPGFSDPAQAAGVVPVWPRLAQHLTRLGDPSTGTDVIVDAGRLTTAYPPLPLLAAADIVLLVVRATLRSASAARPAVESLRRGLGTARVARIGLLVIESGEYSPSDLARALGPPVLSGLPWRAGEAAALSDGIGRVVASAALLRSAKALEPLIAQRIAAVSAPTAPHPDAAPGGTRSGGTAAPGPATEVRVGR